MTEKEKYVVEFKLKSFIDRTKWEDTPVIGTLICMNDDEANEAATILSGVFKQECRWNWLWSNQGHYIYHPTTFALYFPSININPEA